MIHILMCAAFLLLISAGAAANRLAITHLPYGPETCAAGFVWRDGFPGDTVCVTPLTRQRTRQEYLMHPARVAP